jgi:uncharacterized protein
VTLETLLSDAEIGELGAYLMSEATSDECMDLVTLDGFLTALVVGPRLVAPSVWLPVVWGDTSEPVFESGDQAERIIGLLLRRMNMISSMFGKNSAGFEPLLYEREVKGTRFWLADDWCFGFIRAMELGREAGRPGGLRVRGPGARRLSRRIQGTRQNRSILHAKADVKSQCFSRKTLR